MSLEQQIHTVSAYGYRLGGPRAWNLHRFEPGDELRTVWYDETDPTHDFAACATAATMTKLGLPAHGHPELALPFAFEEALEVSPPGWTRETGAPPQLGHNLPDDHALRSLDRVAVTQFVLVIADSLFDRDAESIAHHSGEDYDLDPAVYSFGDPDLDWDDALIAALTTLGLEPVGVPDWLWFRSTLSYG
jgi:hypothetical protein